MRKILLMAVAIIGMSACSSQGNQSQEESAATVDTVALTDTAVLVQQVNDLYAAVISVYDDMDSLLQAGKSIASLPNVDSLYCSRDWNECVKSVKDFDAKHNDGMIGFFEGDYWIMGQDWKDLSISDVQAKSITDSTAVVEIMLHNMGEARPVKLDMVIERDQWLIDNFTDVETSFDWKASMKEYLSDYSK